MFSAAFRSHEEKNVAPRSFIKECKKNILINQYRSKVKAARVIQKFFAALELEKMLEPDSTIAFVCFQRCCKNNSKKLAIQALAFLRSFLEQSAAYSLSPIAAMVETLRRIDKRRLGRGCNQKGQGLNQ